jgi:hypothetical protein
MARIDYVPSGRSSTQAESTEQDYRREGAEDKLELLGVEARKGGSGKWRVTEEFDRNGRTVTRKASFDTQAEAKNYVNDCMAEEQSEDETEGMSRAEVLARAGHNAGRGKS